MCVWLCACVHNVYTCTRVTAAACLHVCSCFAASPPQAPEVASQPTAGLHPAAAPTAPPVVPRLNLGALTASAPLSLPQPMADQLTTAAAPTAPPVVPRLNLGAVTAAAPRPAQQADQEIRSIHEWNPLSPRLHSQPLIANTVSPSQAAADVPSNIAAYRAAFGPPNLGRASAAAPQQQPQHTQHAQQQAQHGMLHRCCTAPGTLVDAQPPAALSPGEWCCVMVGRSFYMHCRLASCPACPVCPPKSARNTRPTCCKTIILVAMISLR